MSQSFYLRTADKIVPLRSPSSMEEAKALVHHTDHNLIVATDEPLCMNPISGSVGFPSDWPLQTVEDLIKVCYE